MNDFVLIDQDVIEEDALREFVARIGKLKQAEIRIHAQWQVWSEDAAVMTALDALFGSMLPVAPTKKTAKDGKKGKRLYLATGGGRGQSITVSKAGEQLAAEHEGGIPDPDPEPVGEHKQIRTWEVHIPGVTGKTTDNALPEKITIDEKNHRLNAGLFTPGTLLRHPKAGFSRVTGTMGAGQGMEAITPTEAIKLLDD
jgi:hypothetical protein